MAGCSGLRDALLWNEPIRHNETPTRTGAGGRRSLARAARAGLGLRPLPGVRLTLISESGHAPYSGMLPEHFAGFSRWEEMHIDLRWLCNFAGVKLVSARVTGLGPEATPGSLRGW